MLSIIIPTKNEEDYLPKLLESIKNQDFEKDFEIIVADAKSSDKTREIAKSFGCKIVKGGLPAKGRNKGAKIAKGAKFLFIDADVILPKDFLENALSEFERRKLDCASFFSFPTKPKIIYKIIFSFYNIFAKMFGKVFPVGWMAILIKKDLHFKIKGFDEKIKIGEDHWYVRKAKKFGKFGIIRSAKIFGSPRRFEKEGIFVLCLKYIFVGIYTILFGPLKRDIIRYEFNHYKN